MFYYILGIFLCLLIITVVFKPKKYKTKSLSLEMKEEDFINGLRSLARESRNTTHINRYLNVNIFLPIFHKLYRVLAKKANIKPLSQGELWYYQNFYHLDRYINNFSVAELNRLPQALGGIRVVELAKFIVQNSYGILTIERIEKSIEAINGEINLTIDENLNFKKAIGYALIVELYKLTDRLLFKNKMEKTAKIKGVKERYLTSDIYIHFLLKGENFSKISKYIEKVGLNSKTIETNYNKTLVENEKISRNLFNLLINIDETVHIDKIVKQTYIYKKCANLEYFDIHSPKTILNYLTKLSKISKKFNLSEIETFKRLEEFSNFNKQKISIILDNHLEDFISYLRFPKRLKKAKNHSTTLRQVAYIITVILLTAGSLIGLFILTRNILLCIFAIIPVYFVIEKTFNYIISLGINEKQLPMANYKSIPIERSSLVVISEYLTSKEQARTAVKNLLSIKETSKDKNIHYSMLIDLMPSENLQDEKDEEIISELSSLIGRENINIFVRERVKIGKKYSAFERKRGALICLAKYLMTGNDSEFRFILNKNMLKPTYLLTLDSDNRVLANGIKDLINVMAHPSNEKYDLISLRSKFNLFSNKNLYTNDFFDERYLEKYPDFSTLYYNMFGLDIYCGKGIFKLKEFYNKFIDLIPHGKLLSHDILEGAILKTASYGVVYEDAPSGFLSDIEREKRWQRGDIGLQQFVKDRWKNASKQKVLAKKPLFYKFLIVRNVAHILRPTALVLMFLSFVLKYSLVGILSALGIFLLPYIIDGMQITLSAIKNNIRLRYYVKKMIKLMLNILKDIFILPYKCLQNTTIYLSTTYKIIANKNLLQWKTYYQSQKTKAYSLFLAKTSLVYIFLAIFTGLGFLNNLLTGLIIAVYSLMSILTLNLEYFKGLISLDRTKKRMSEQETVLDIAKKTYKYFCYIERKDFLPADNLQIKPYKGISMTTSPTNIGFYLCSLICAYKLELESLEVIKEKIKVQIENIKNLEKFKGNLYNWYFIDKKNPATNFVSSVDSGNFLACLIVLKEFLKEESLTSIQEDVEKIIENTNLDCLYDESTNMFYLGYDVLDGIYSGHYDLFASESRLLSYIYSSIKGKSDNYFKLIRDYDGYCGNTLMSWSGTMFEYLMPDLFLSSPINSLTYKTNKNIVKLQYASKINKIFGISESGYYAFDDNLYYQYKAFGVKKIALDNSINQTVISPYSSLMAINVDKVKVIKNIAEMKRKGLYTDYGFYEGVDYAGDKRILYSYMTHHQGMIMLALTNFLTKEYIKRLFFADSRMNGNKLLLTEETSESKFFKTPQYNEIKVMTEKQYEVFIEKPQPRGMGLTNGNISIFADAFGKGFTKYNNIYLNYFDFDKNEEKGSFFYIKKGGEIATSSNFRKDVTNKYQVYHNGEKIVYNNSYDGIKEEIFIDEVYSNEIRKLYIKDKNSEIFYYEELSLSYKYEKESHRVFADMFIKTEYDEKNHLLLAQKTFKNGKSIYYGLLIRGGKDIIVETDRFNFIGRNKDIKEPKFLFATDGKVSVGEVLSPCFGFRCLSENGEIEIVKIFGESKKELYEKVENITGDYLANIQVQDKIKLLKLTNDLLYPLIYNSFNNETLKYIDKYNKKENFFIYNGNKSILYKLENQEGLEPFKELVNSISELKHFGIIANVIIVYSDSFEGEIEEVLRKILSEKTINNYHIYKEAQLSEDIDDYAFITLDRKLEVKPFKEVEFNDLKEDYAVYATDIEEDVSFISGEGYFDKDGDYNLSKVPKLPYSNVVCMRKGGFISTENGIALAYFENSRELKSLKFDNDPVGNKVYEKLYCEDRKEKVILDGALGSNKRYKVKRGLSEFCYESEFMKGICESYMIDEGVTRVKQITLYNKEGGRKPQKITLDYTFQIAPLYDNKYTFIAVQEDNFVIKNLMNDQKVYLKIIGLNKLSIESLEYIHQNNRIQITFEIAYDQLYELFILQSSNIIPNLTKEQIMFKKESGIHYFECLNPFEIKTNNKSLDLLFNDYLMYQIVSSRLNGKCGYYQVGGATGFRDQLQDAIALLYGDRERVREQILYSASRQYEEGDVMHWWHHEKFGLRTKISDDKLYLPYLVSLYIDVTGDTQILKEKVPYLHSNVLGENEHTRFENPPYTDYTETILKHCYKAIKSSLKFGKHNLMLLGGGDWNDGIDFIGSKGLGESVHLTMFCYEVINKFAKYAEEKHKIALLDVADKLKSAVESFAFQDKQYLRVFGDDGKWYGSSSGDVYNIDLTVQSYAVLSQIGSEERQLSAINSVEENLVDESVGIIKLLNGALTPDDYIGYISTYPKGVRENGGQYTHSTMWYLLALCKKGKNDLAYKHFNMVNPLYKCSTELNEIYKGEPYVLSGDVYSNGRNKGRMGWSWYTGSASWCYKLILEEFLGVKIIDNRIVISFNRPKLLNVESIKYRYKESEYTLNYIKGDNQVVSEDIEIKENSFELRNKGNYTIDIYYQ